MEGNLIKWQKWHIRIGFTWREGLVIYNVNYEDEGRLRPILFRASIAEMAVPYAESQVCAIAQRSQLGRPMIALMGMMKPHLWPAMSEGLPCSPAYGSGITRKLSEMELWGQQ